MDIADPSNQVAFAALAEQTLGSNLHGMALGNEPDLYDRPGHGKREGTRGGLWIPCGPRTLEWPNIGDTIP